MRSLATSFCSGLPVLALLLFGGETLKAFAFALLVGTISGTYSSVFIAGPVLTAWKEREPVYRRRHAAIALENGGVVPAFATAGAAMELGPKERAPPRAPDGARRSRDQDVSREEFEEMVRDLHVDEPGAQGGAAVTKPKAAPTPSPSRSGRARPDRRRAARGRRHARPPGRPAKPKRQSRGERAQAGGRDSRTHGTRSR